MAKLKHKYGKQLMFIPPYRVGGSSAIYSCKINVKESVKAARVCFTLRSKALSVKLDMKCVRT